MLESARHGFLNATDCADYLVRRGMAFRDAYKITGALVAHCIDNKTTLESLPLSDFKSFCELFEEDVYESLDLVRCVNERKVYGGPARESVERQIEGINRFLGNC